MDMVNAYPAKWLKNQDLTPFGDDETTQCAKFVIDSVDWEDMQDGTRKPGMTFSKCSIADLSDKIFILNKTNNNSLIEKYGRDSEDWRGKVVEIFVTRTTFSGKTVDCLRVRFPKGPAKTANSAATEGRASVLADTNHSGLKARRASDTAIGELDDVVPW